MNVGTALIPLAAATLIALAVLLRSEKDHRQTVKDERRLHRWGS